MQNPYKVIALVDTSYLFAVNWHAQKNGGHNNAGVDTLRQIGRLRFELGSESGERAHVICCVDSPPYARSTLYAQYKAGREDPGPAYYVQRDRLLEQLDREGFQLGRAPGFEADDIVATLTAAYRLVCDDIRIVSADKDSYQLVNHKVRLFVPAIGDRPSKIVDEDKVMDLTGVKPSLMIDWQALVGDKGDNVPGCDGVGPKNAAKMLGKYGSIDGLYRAMQAQPAETALFVGKAIFASLKKERAAVLMSRQLVQLQTNAPVNVDALLKYKAPDHSRDEPNVSPPLEDERDADDSAFNAPGADGYYAPGADGHFTTADQDFAMLQAAEDAKRRAKEPRRGEDGPMPTDEEEQRARERVRKQREADKLDPAQVISPPRKLPDPEASAKLDEAARVREEEKKAGPAVPPAEPAHRPRKTRPVETDGLVVDATPPTTLVLGPSYALALEPKNMTQAVWVSQELHKAGLFPKLESWQAHLGIMMVGREMGLSTMSSLMNFEIVEGRPTPRWQLIMACAVQHRECEYFVMVESNDELATFETKRKRNDQPDSYTYTIEMAQKAGLVKPNSGYQKHPAALMRKMCCVHLSRVVYPDSKALGLYFPEELGVAA